MNKTEFVYTTYIKTTPEKLWAAITNPEFTRQYWGGHVNVSEWKKGATWQHQDTNNGNMTRVTGKIVEYDPHNRLVMSWHLPDDQDDVSTVTMEISQAGDLMRLDVIHGDFKPNSTMAEKVSKGWPLVLSSLKSFLETGKAIDILAVKTGCNAEAA